jgi:hypothetical protein
MARLGGQGTEDASKALWSRCAALPRPVAVSDASLARLMNQDS